MRFSELQRAIPQATPKMLVQQLREMEADELVSRSDVREDAFTGVADHECRLQDGRASVHELTRIREEAEVVALWERLENRSPFLGDEIDAANGTNGTFPTRPNLPNAQTRFQF